MVRCTLLRRIGFPLGLSIAMLLLAYIAVGRRQIAIGYHLAMLRIEHGNPCSTMEKLTTLSESFSLPADALDKLDLPKYRLTHSGRLTASLLIVRLYGEEENEIAWALVRQYGDGSLTVVARYGKFLG